MKRITLLTVLLACGLVGTSTPAFAQITESTSSTWIMGKVDLLLIGRDDVQSSKFEEYREVPKGVSMPDFTLKGSWKGNDYGLFSKGISQSDQRYTGYYKTSWGRVAVDYNQIPHNMGNHGHSIEAETAPGVWSLSSTLRGALGTAVDTKMPTSARTYPFYADLYAPTIAAASVVNVSSLRQRGNAEFELGKDLPFDLKVNYIRDVKSGYRGSGGGVVYSAVNNIVELPEALDEVTQDLGFRVGVSRKWGNAYAAYNHNWYNNRQETTVFDNPLRATDQAYTAAVGSTVPPLGGPASGRLIGPPDNSADNTSFGVLLKFAKQTRLTADFAVGRWNQAADVYPYTINSTILTPAGVRADSLAALDTRSLNGKIDTTTLNFAFTSRPVENLTLRARYRSYELDNNTPTFIRTGNVGNAPDRSWTVAPAPTADAPFGYPTANPYGSKTGRFDLMASYDIHDLTFEGTYRNVQIDRTYREATEGAEDGWSVAAILHSADWMRFRGVFDSSHRTASGYDPATSLGLQADESERETTTVGLDLELSVSSQVSVMAAYFRRYNDYPNRPNRAAGVEGTSNGLLEANYDTYTVELDWSSPKYGEVGFFYTYEKNLSTTRYGGTGSSAAPPYTPLMSMLTFDGSDRADTFGVNARVVLQPEKYTFLLNANRQKVDGLLDVTGDPGGSFALARVSYGGIQDITDYNDTELQTIVAQLEYAVAKSWAVTFGYAFEKYIFSDAYSIFGNQTDAGQFDDGNQNFPASGGFYLKANDGDYNVNMVFAKMTYRW